MRLFCFLSLMISASLWAQEVTPEQEEIARGYLLKLESRLVQLEAEFKELDAQAYDFVQHEAVAKKSAVEGKKDFAALRVKLAVLNKNLKKMYSVKKSIESRMGRNPLKSLRIPEKFTKENLQPYLEDLALLYPPYTDHLREYYTKVPIELLPELLGFIHLDFYRKGAQDHQEAVAHSLLKRIESLSTKKHMALIIGALKSNPHLIQVVQEKSWELGAQEKCIELLAAAKFRIEVDYRTRLRVEKSLPKGILQVANLDKTEVAKKATIHYVLMSLDLQAMKFLDEAYGMKLELKNVILDRTQDLYNRKFFIHNMAGIFEYCQVKLEKPKGGRQ